MDNIQNKTFENLSAGFDLPSDVLDEIQVNIQNIIEGFDIPDSNKTDVIKKINFMYSQTKHMSVTDALTGLYNRRHFECCFDREFSRAKRYKNDVSFAIIDIDFFKKINDTYGHSCGDYILKEVAYLISSSFRLSDMVFRYGGEEFVVILTETSLQDAYIPLERLREKIENTVYNFRAQRINVTISIGASAVAENVMNPYELFDLADKVLYEAKENGRNQVKLSN